VNLAKVRSGNLIPKIALAASLIGALACPSAAAQPRITIALLPNGTGIEDLRGVPRLAPGLLSAGLGEVPAAQTYLDVTQGNRVFDSLYDGDLPALRVRGRRVEGWGRVLERAGSAPADIVPGLLGSEAPNPVGRPVQPAHSATKAGQPSGSALPTALLDVDRAGRLRGRFQIRSGEVGELAAIVGALRGRDLLIALQRPPPGENEQLAVGIAGRGFEGTLTSDSTRLEGYVLATDLAPTILERLGLAVPSEMSGEPIRAEGEPDFEAVAALGERLAAIPERRGPVIGISVLIWLAAVALALLASRRRLAAPALRLLALAVVYLPVALLAGAALEPGVGVERALVLVGCPLAAALTLLLLPGYRGLAAACALTVAAYAVDVLAGSPLTALALIGPNPGLGVRFFGIGNELEAVLAPLAIVGTGAALAGFAPLLRPRSGAIAFLACGLACALVFAAGRFGADVGAAIVFPVGAAVAAGVLSGRRRVALLALAAPLLALAALALADLASGGDAHLTRSVLDAGGLDQLADVAERRLRLSAKSFGRAITSPFLPLAIVIIAIAVRHRERLFSWLTPYPPMRAAFLGAVAAIAVGTLANDSGALLLEIGTGYLLVVAGFAWAEGGNRPQGRV